VGQLDAERADSLGLGAGALVLRVERTIDFVGAAQAVVAVLWCRTDNVRFSQTLALDGAAAELRPLAAGRPPSP
jgi:hypothetical protein